MLEEKIREVFADMVVLKDPQRSEYFSNLSIPSYMRDWLVMKFSDDEGAIDYDSVRRYIKRYIPSRDDFEQYKFQMVNGETVKFLARVRVSVDVKTGKTMFELPDFGGARGGASGVVDYDVADKWQDTLLREVMHALRDDLSYASVVDELLKTPPKRKHSKMNFGK